MTSEQRGRVTDSMVVYHRQNLVRHGRPFAKRAPGKHRRTVRRFTRTMKEQELVGH